MNAHEGKAPASPGVPDLAGAPAALSLEAIVKTFGGFTALNGVDFELRPGEVHALLGENGAGKSTLMNIAAGIYTPDSGQVSVGGMPVVISGPADARALGIGMVHQHYKLVRSFTALENIMIANPGGGYRQATARLRLAAATAAATMGFSLDLDRKVEDLSISDQQRLEILRVLIAGARVVVLDEPTAVLTDDESARLFGAVRSLADEGRAVVLVTHKLSEALTHADRITVMRGGKVVATVLPGSVDERALTEMIVGSNVVERTRPAERVGAPVLSVRGLDCKEADGARALDGVAFELRAGEIYGLAGVGGNGQEALVEVLTGLRAPSAGSIHFGAHGDVAGLPPERLRSFGIGCIPSDRQAFALANDLPVADNFAVGGALKGRYGSMLLVNRARMRRDTAEAVSRFEIAGVRGLSQKAGLLSGGNAQKLVIAREFSSQPVVVTAHSPSRGLDVRATASVHEHLRAARDRGAGVLLISEDLDEILLLSDRIGVMSRGKVVAEFDTADRQAIGKAMIGHA
jgi:ABC-type uncharacterized transport system ATPase subunit